MPSKRLLIINGPNLNMLGKREPEVYGSETLDSIESETNLWASKKDIELTWYQSNIEGELVSRVQKATTEDFDGLIINPGGYSHTSVALLDALKLFIKPIIEVHISNTHLREEFRNVKITAKASTSVIEGFGKKGYLLAIESFI